jgi:tetratricopeptide (TPR) repeat protein
MRQRQDHRRLILAVVLGLIGVGATVGAFRAGRSSPEDLALRRARAQRAGGDLSGAFSTLVECVRSVPRACRCADDAMELAVDANRYGDGIFAAHESQSCASARHAGGLAELLVATGRLERGLETAATALAQAPDEPHACLAKAWALSTRGSSPEALDLAERAVRAHRGVPALLVLAILREGANDHAGARLAIEQAARLGADDARVAYELGVVEAGDRHYREAREAFLHALALDPKLADARYQLALLAHSVRADDEARHDLDELATISPNDPRIPELRAALGVARVSPAPKE